MAALNIDGLTIHRLLKIIPQRDGSMRYDPLPKEKLKELYETMKDVKLFIIDEYSMVSSLMLHFIHSRLQQIFAVEEQKGAPSGSFGGRNLVLFGDILQLKPVSGQFCFQKMTPSDVQQAGGGIPLAYNLMDEFAYSELENNMRQKDDAIFQQVSGNVRVGNLTEEDVTLLESRRIAGDKKPTLQEQIQHFKGLCEKDPNCLYLVPLCTLADEFNEAMLDSMKITVEEIHAIDTTAKGAKKPSRKQAKKRQTKVCALTKFPGVCGLFLNRYPSYLLR